MNTAKLQWVTPDGDALIGYMARVSNPNAKRDDDASRLIRFLIEKRHWSPFDMVNMCVEVVTTRDIGRQILRHWSIHPQEFSQRYAVIDASEIPMKEMRLKGTTNRQGSLEDRHAEFEIRASQLVMDAFALYESMIKGGIAPECARSVLPEGYTPTTLYLNGTVRSWIHYLEQRLDHHAQKEHRLIAQQIDELFRENFPNVAKAVSHE